MSEFTTRLHVRITEAQRAIIAATRDGSDDDVDLYLGELHDLLELAARNDVNATDWVDPVVMEIVHRDES